MLSPFAELVNAKPIPIDDAFPASLTSTLSRTPGFAQAKISRGQLKAAAAKYKVRPQFLFPDERGNSAEPPQRHREQGDAQRENVAPNKKRIRKTRIKLCIEEAIVLKGAITL